MTLPYEVWRERVKAGQKVEAMFPFDANLEDNTIDIYNQFLLTCQQNGDSVSAKIFEAILDDEQAHYNYFDSVNDHIKKLGGTYLAKIAGTSSSTGLTPKGFAVAEGGE